MSAALAAAGDSPAVTERDDATLVADFRGGMEAAFAELVRRHQIPVFRLLLGMTSDADEAELYCEQVFFEAARRLPDKADTQPFVGWLLGLTREVVQKAESKRPKATVPRKRGPRPRDPKALVKHEVKTALSDLNSDERVALILADLEGDSIEEIARTLGTTPERAETLVHTARTKFERGLEQASEPAVDLAPTADDLLPEGTVLGGRFRIESLLGKGGMGAVYRALDVTNDQPVAVKTLLPSSERDPALRRRFAREAEIIQRLQHPNFVRLIDHGMRDGEPSYVAMELVDGSALDRVLERELRLPPERALHVVRHVLRGLVYAHGQGVIHRDLKPENVMLLKQGTDTDFAKMLDLGIAKLTGSEDAHRTRLTQQNELIGTPLYISPEMLRGEALDARADLYSLTVVLYEMLASRPPFAGKTATALFAMHLVTPPPPLSDTAPEIALPELEQLLQAGLAKEPSARIPSAESYLRRVAQLLSLDWSKLPKSSRTVATIPARKATPRALGASEAAREELAAPSRRRGPLAALAALVALLLVGVWIWYARG